MAYQSLNLPPNHWRVFNPLPDTFTLTTPPGTDIWRKPPALDSFNAPLVYRVIDLKSFKKARVTVKAEWKTLFDQGGLCFILPGEGGTAGGENRRKWIKSGIEFTHGSPHVSTVACDRWADWSLLPLEGTEVTVEMEREVVEDKPTSTLWVYAVQGEARRPLREVTWVFEKEEGQCWVGVYAAKPTKDERDEKGESRLKVEFSGLESETLEG